MVLPHYRCEHDEKRVYIFTSNKLDYRLPIYVFIYAYIHNKFPDEWMINTIAYCNRTCLRPTFLSEI